MQKGKGGESKYKISTYKPTYVHAFKQIALEDSIIQALQPKSSSVYNWLPNCQLIRNDHTSHSQVFPTLISTQIFKWNWSLQRFRSHKSILASYSSMTNKRTCIDKWKLKVIFMNNIKLDKDWRRQQIGRASIFKWV